MIATRLVTLVIVNVEMYQLWAISSTETRLIEEFPTLEEAESLASLISVAKPRGLAVNIL